ncbi:MAG: hypothetical protein IKY87_05715 [Paludibacteraceae bacterium]|nr:hypothetical protein [Paludibacteraceae bacterium]
MKILILSCNTGEGHNSCAKALKKAMDRRGIACEIQDTLALISATLSYRVSNAYVYSTRGSLFEMVYKLGGFVSNNTDSRQSLIYSANKLYAERLHHFIIDNGFDIVVCVHLFPAEALTALKRNAQLQIPTYFVMTDYTCIPFLPETDLDYYIIPHEHLIEEFAERGIPREKIIPIGIPVDEQLFTTRQPQLRARHKIAQQMGWKISDATGHWYLLMSGSMGFGNLSELVEQLLQAIRPEDRVICICGRNEEMHHSLQEVFADNPQLLVLGFTDQVSLLMDASNVIFTKPGGVTSTEAIVKHIPLIHTVPIPGLEDRNAHFFHQHGLSYYTNDVAQQVAVAMRLCQDKAYRQQMLRQQREHANTRSSDDFIDLILSNYEASATQ